MKASELKTAFAKQGFVVIDTELADSVLDGASNDLSPYFGDNRQEPIHAASFDHNRIQDAWHISQNVLAIALSEKVSEALFTLYEKPAQAFQTLNFYRGTQQDVHSDSIHFNSEPFGAMCGVWVALEDISEDQGPLIYYPGSHKLPEMNYDDFGLIPSYDSYPEYLKQIQELIKKHQYQAEYGVLKKGQAVIWSANVFHGGSFQNDKTLTRKSQVTHYYIGQPKCWRPSMSKRKRVYFKPDVVRDMSNQPYKYPIKRKLPLRVYSAIKQRVLKTISEKN